MFLTSIEVHPVLYFGGSRDYAVLGKILTKEEVDVPNFGVGDHLLMNPPLHYQNMCSVKIKSQTEPAKEFKMRCTELEIEN